VQITYFAYFVNEEHYTVVPKLPSLMGQALIKLQ